MLNKILLATILGVFVGFMPAGAQTTPTAPARIKGSIVAARVQGHVEAVSNTNGTKVLLHDGDKVSDQTTVTTAPGANVILAFSNGATVNVAGDSNLNIEEFEQDPFAADVKLSELKQEPGTSTTKLSLTKGELVGKVVHLNVDRGSEFTVQTPVGAAGIRGTIFRIVFRPDPSTGKAFFVVTTADGRVVFTGTTSGPVSIPAGKTVTATVNYTPSTSPNEPPTVEVVKITNSDLSNVSTTESTQITSAVQDAAASTNNTNFNGSGTGGGGNGNGNGNGGNNNTPAPPVVPQPPLTSGAGSG